MFKCRNECGWEWSAMLSDDDVPDRCPDCACPVIESRVEYKVWVHVERIDEAADEYADVGLPDSLGVFDTLDEANRFVLKLLGRYAPDAIPTSDRNIRQLPAQVERTSTAHGENK